jgi:transcriptional regulator with XRE-family HTH domain
MPPKYAKFAAYLTRRRRARKLNQTELAKLVGVGKSSVFNWEAGHHRPDPAYLGKLADVLDVPLPDLYAAAGYTLPASLADVEPYLRARHPKLPNEAIAEATAFFRDLEGRYGGGDADRP